MGHPGRGADPGGECFLRVFSLGAVLEVGKKHFPASNVGRSLVKICLFFKLLSPKTPCPQVKWRKVMFVHEFIYLFQVER